MAGVRQRRLAGALLAGLVLAGAGCPQLLEREEAVEAPPPPEPIAVRLSPVTRRSLSARYETSATLRAERQALITARTAGVIRSFAVEEGDAVSAAQPLCLLEDDEQRIERSRSQALLEQQERAWERAQRLHGRAFSDDDLERARRELDDARHRAELAELNLSRTRIAAPFAGRVLERRLDVGATVSAGTPLLLVADLDPLCADVSVPERHLPRLAAGQPVELRSDLGQQAAAARIERIAPAVDPATGTVKVTVALADAASALRPGTFVRVSVVTDTHPQALVVPRAALVAEGRSWSLFRVLPGARVAERIPVVLGFDDEAWVEVLPAHDGATLHEGDRVVSAGAAALSDGAPVVVHGG